MAASRLRVLWISHLVPYPPKGGVTQRCFNLIRELSRWHDIDLIAFNQRALLPTGARVRNAVGALSQFCAVRNVVDIPSDVAVGGRAWLLARGLLSPDGYTLSWLRSRTMDATLRQLARDGAYDVVHFDTISLAPYLNTIQGTINVLNHHNVESQMAIRRSGRERNLMKRGYLWLEGRRVQDAEREWCPRFELNAVCSALDGERLRELAPRARIAVVPNGVDLAYFQPHGAPQDPHSLVFAGGMGWYPNKDAMLWFAHEVWPVLRSKHSEVTMTVVGANPPRALRRVAQEEPRFRVTGFVPDVRPFLEGASVYVCPIRDGGGTRLKVLDALAMGKAIVAHPIAVEGLGVEDGTHVVLATEPKAFATEVLRLLEDDRERERLGRVGRQVVESHYDVARIGQQYGATLAALVSERSDVRRGGRSPGVADSACRTTACGSNETSGR